MDSAGHHLFTGAALATNQHAGGTLGDAVQQSLEGAHRLALADQLIDPHIRIRLLNLTGVGLVKGHQKELLPLHMM